MLWFINGTILGLLWVEMSFIITRMKNIFIILISVCLASFSVFAKAGALIKVQMKSAVGFLLDEIPASAQNRSISELMEKPQSFWRERAKAQLEATLYRLVYRGAFYDSKKGRLPLPPKELWNIEVQRPKLVTIDSHRFVAANYVFQSVLLASVISVLDAEPALVKVGGRWREPFVLPVDPELLFERTGYACMDEADFPPNSVDSENARAFYDHSCAAGKNNCHVTMPYPSESCAQAMQKRVGRINTFVEFQRLPWNENVARRYRLGDTSSKNPELEVLGHLLENNRITYRYVAPDSCAVVEGCVGGSGWRRLLQFDASIANRGQLPIHLGHISPESLLVKKNMFEFSPCHGHYHFSHYGKFTYGAGAKELSSKRAFCLASTSRYSNNEETPLSHQYTCHNQGIEAGWGDDYIAGIECQWLDITDIKGPHTSTLGFQANPDQFLCEGNPILDAENNFTFIPTDFKTGTGAVQHRIACEFSAGWEQNNLSQRSVTIPERGSLITKPCERGQVSPLRNCGFTEQKKLQSCIPGAPVKLFCSAPAQSAAVMVRICEASAVLGVGVGCMSNTSLAQIIIEENGQNSVEATFACPSLRDQKEPGGKFAVYTSPLHTRDPLAAVNCMIRP